MRLPFQQVDVFTTVALRGNPVAVVLDASGLGPETMQAFAAWTNLSETTFVLPGDDEADYRVRIFTPTAELPFAGHPTLGTCHAWLTAGGVPRDGGLVVQRCEAGLIPIRRGGTGLAFAAPPLIRSGPVDAAVRAALADLLGLGAGDIVAAQWVDSGPGWVAVLLGSAAAVLAVRRPGPDAFAALAAAAGPVTAGRLGVGLIGPHPAGGPATYEVRAFTPLLGGVEDPVTGSLNGSLAQWLLGAGRARAPYTVSQGAALGRAGLVRITTTGPAGSDATGGDATGGDAAGGDATGGDATVWVGGGTITTISGSVEL